MPLLGLTLPPGDHARGLPTWLRLPSAGLEGDPGVGCPPAGLQAGLGHGGHALPCPWGWASGEGTLGTPLAVVLSPG